MKNEKVLTEEEKAYLEMVLKDHNRKLNNFSVLNKIVAKNEVVIAGDSITEGFPIRDIIHDKGVIYNRGISGFKAYQLEEKLDVVVFNIDPKKVFYLIGTNDIADGCSIEEVFQSIKHILDQTIEHLPNTEIFVCGILPINEKIKFSEGVYIRKNKTIIAVNEKVKTYVEGSNFTYIDTFNWMSDGLGLKETYTYDGLHLNADGYVQLSKILRKYL